MSVGALRRSAPPETGLQAVVGRRIYDPNNAIWMVKLFPGEYYVTRRTDEVLVTVLGSCVSACIRDPQAGVGGMNHFMLPQNASGAWGEDAQSARFGNFAMEKLINELIKAGCARERLEIKVFGGGNVTESSNAIGSNNADFVLRYLAAEGLPCAAEDLGGSLPRRIHYYPATGRAVRRLLGVNESSAVTREESDYGNRLRGQKSFGDIELFGGKLMIKPAAPVRVLIVDDSAVMRQMLTSLLSADPEIEVVGTASDPHVARERIKALNPDVISLDIEMPRMDGLTFLRKIMALRPMPVVMVSTLTQAGAEITLEALEAGAVDFVAKPTDLTHGREALAAELQAKIKAAARTRLRPRNVPVAAQKVRSFTLARDKIVFIGASTGGVEALKTVLMNLPAECPPILITQHMPARFTTAFAERLNRECPMRIAEAQDGAPIEAGHVYIAPGSHHLQIETRGGRSVCAISDAPPVSGHRPSVDVLFQSAARLTRASAVGVILTGMGKDGAEGLLAMREAGAITLGQDEASSLIYGMPRVAFERGAVMRQCALTNMADAILDACEADPSRLRTSHHAA